MKFEELKSRWDWSPIRNCPGRFVGREGGQSVSPGELVAGGGGGEIQFGEFRVENAKDTVVVGRFFGGGGLISYRRADGTYLHTLNTADGFERKLAQLGIKF